LKYYNAKCKSFEFEYILSHDGSDYYVMKKLHKPTSYLDHDKFPVRVDNPDVIENKYVLTEMTKAEVFIEIL